MESFDLIIRLFEILIWPIVVVVLAILFRRNISELITRVQRIKGEKWEIEIRDQIAQASETAKELLPEIVNVETKKAITEINIQELAKTFPSAAVFEAWKLVEKAAKELIERKGYKHDYNIDTPYKLIEDSLIKGHLADKQTGMLFHDLRQLRNKLAHSQGFTVSPDLASQYVELAIRLRDKLDKIAT